MTSDSNVRIQTLNYDSGGLANFVPINRVEMRFVCWLKLLNVKWSAADTVFAAYAKEWKKDISSAARDKIKESVSKYWMNLVDCRPYLIRKAQKIQKSKEIQQKRDKIQQNINQIALLQQENATLEKEVATMRNTHLTVV